jgi:Leucine-rich repeat (LRR) protein
LPLSICELQMLERINIENNNIRYLPAEFFKLPNLKSFKMSKTEVYFEKKQGYMD